MTPYTNLTDEQIDRLVAERIRGWHEDIGAWWKDLPHDSDEFVCYVNEYTPSTNLNQAFEAVKKIGKSGWYLMLYGTGGIYTAYMRKPDKDGVVIESAMAKPDPSPARAICIALLEAKDKGY